MQKHLAKDLDDEGENISLSDEEQTSPYLNHQDKKLHRSTILDQDYENDSLISLNKNDKDSSESSLTGSSDGILPLLEGFVKKGDLSSIKQFQCLIKGEIQKALIYRAIEQRQVQMLKYLMTETGKIGMNLSLLHIACRSKENT